MAALGNPLTGCIGNSATSPAKLNLGGRVISPTTLLRLASAGSCDPNETTVAWNQINDLQYVKATDTLPGLVAAEFRAYCPAGKQATSGGYIVDLDVNLGNNIRVNTSAPASNNQGNYWYMVAENFNNPATPNSTANVTVYSVCQTLAAGVHPAGLTAANSATPNLYENPVKLGS